MARKKPAKKAKKKPAAKAAAKKSAKKSMKKASKKPAKKAAPAYAKASTSAKASADRSAGKKKKAAKPAKRAAAKKAAPKKKAAARKSAAKTAAPASAKASTSAKASAERSAGKPKKAAASPAAGKKPNLDRPRKTVADIHGIPSSLDANRGPSAAKSGRAEMKDRVLRNTSTSPALTSGDVDADWESAESSGDELPGGDNPTPDQDVVDDIGRALGVEYDDDEELQGGAEISDRDRHRWELDPSSKDDFDETE